MRDRSLKDEMRAAVQGDRERAEARRKAEEEGEYTGPAPPTLDLNKPSREWKLPEKTSEPEVEPTPKEPVARPEPEPEPEPEPKAESEAGLLARLRALFR